MPDQPFALEAHNYPKPHSVVGLEITVLVSRETTGGHEITLSTRAGPGAFFHFPAGTVHAFRIKEDGTAMMGITGAGSRSSSMFRSISEDVAPGRSAPADMPKLVEILGRYGAKVHA